MESHNNQEVENMVDAIKDGVYVFDLKLLCGGYAYFSTFTLWTGFGKSYRDIRKPDLVNIKHFHEILSELGHFNNKSFFQKGLVIGNQEQYERWLYRKGWGFVTKEYVQIHMSQWLKQRECLRSPLGIFTDIELVPPSSLNQYAHSGIRTKVLERDGKQCLLCGIETQLTMQHVTPYSHGGETTLRNLVTLCHDCNQRCGAEILTELYDLAGLHYGFDPSLVKKMSTKESIYQAMSLSDNLMQTRCEVW
jgi:HNH endonuclease